MAPLAPGAALLITPEFYDTQIKQRTLAIRDASQSDSSGPDSNTAPYDRKAWLFAPVLMLVWIAVTIFWYWLVCSAGRIAKREANKQTDEAKENLLLVVQDLPKPRLWEDISKGSSSADITTIKNTTDMAATGLCVTSSSTPEEICSICLEVFVSTEMIRQMQACNHIFHQHCFEDWVLNLQKSLETYKTKLRCPICRKVIMQTPQKLYLKKPQEAHFVF